MDLVTQTQKPVDSALDSLEPISVNLVLTDRCNYRCKFCFARFRGDLELFNYDRIYEIPCILRNLGTTKLTIEGGEPFLYPKLLERLLSEAKKCEITTMVITNASLIKREDLIRLASVLDWLGISIDSPSEETEVLLGRGYGNHVSKVLEVAQWAKELGILLKTNTVVTKLNINDNLVPILLKIMPKRAKFFQYLHIPGINDDFSDELKVTEEEFWKFVKRHEVLERSGIQVVGETNEYMQGSYLMMFPDGRFFSNYGKYEYTTHTIFDNPYAALREARWDIDKFVKRDGIYEWQRVNVKSSGTIKEVE